MVVEEGAALRSNLDRSKGGGSLQGFGFSWILVSNAAKTGRLDVHTLVGGTKARRDRRCILVSQCAHVWFETRSTGTSFEKIQ